MKRPKKGEGLVMEAFRKKLRNHNGIFDVYHKTYNSVEKKVLGRMRPRAWSGYSWGG